jgi:hypothetical protein
MAEAGPRPAFYAARPGRWRDCWTLLHPPYTAWHLSYVVLGAAVAPEVSVTRLLATLTAFFLAVGIAAHALDELHDRPLHTTIPDGVLVAISAIALGGAIAVGAAGIPMVGWVLLPFIVVGGFLVLAYDLEWFGGIVHSDTGFALAWGSFPVLTGYLAQCGTFSLVALLMAAAGFSLTRAQRSLSNRARLLRRRTRAISGHIVLTMGEPQIIDRGYLLRPLEDALAALSWSAVLVAAAVVTYRLT